MTLKRFVALTAVIAALALPAVGAFAPVPAAAQVATSYYVVHDEKTKKCTIVDKRPIETTIETKIVSGDGVVHKTRTEAEDAMKTVKVCTTQ